MEMDEAEVQNQGLQAEEHEAERAKPVSAPTALIGAFCVKFALPEKAVKALLELLRLRLDVSSITNARQILQSMESAPMNLHESCRNCHADLDFGNCFENWYEISFSA